MNIIWMKRGLEAGVIAGGLWLLGTGLASAQALDHGSSDPVSGLLSAPVTAPITVCGNSIGLLGSASAHCGTTATSGSANSGSTGGGSANGGSTRRPLVNLPVTAPITVCGNAIGRASAGCTATGPTGATAGSGTLANVPVTAPITVCGNGVGLLGASSASCANPTGPHSGGTTGSGGSTVPVTAPVTACGNTVGLLGSAAAGCSGGTSAGTPGSPPGTSGGSTSGGSTISIAAHQAGSRSAVQGLAALRSSERPDSLAFTGSSLVVLEWFAMALLTVGGVLARGWRRQSC